jgi:hypothetical protein
MGCFPCFGSHLLSRLSCRGALHCFHFPVLFSLLLLLLSISISSPSSSFSFLFVLLSFGLFCFPLYCFLFRRRISWTPIPVCGRRSLVASFPRSLLSYSYSSLLLPIAFPCCLCVSFSVLFCYRYFCFGIDCASLGFSGF